MDYITIIAMHINEIIILLAMSGIFLLFNPTRELIFPSFSKIKKQETKNTRLPFLDFAKGVSILAVIVIHVVWFIYQDNLSTSQELFLQLTNNLSRFAIAVFFICSGILIKPLKRYGGYWKFLKKKFSTIILPYLIISLALNLAIDQSWKTTFLNIVSGKTSPPFYFIIVLTQLFLLLPLLYKIKNKKWFLPVAFIISFVSFLFPLTWELFGLNLFFKYIFFFSYGLRMRDYIINEQLKKQNVFVFILVISTFILLFIFLPAHLYNVRLIYGIIIFHFLFWLYPKIKNKLVTNCIGKYGRLSLWVFLIHYPVLNILFFVLQNLNLNFYSFYFLLFFSGLITSTALALSARFFYNRFLFYILQK